MSSHCFLVGDWWNKSFAVQAFSLVCAMLKELLRGNTLWRHFFLPTRVNANTCSLNIFTTSKLQQFFKSSKYKKCIDFECWFPQYWLHIYLVQLYIQYLFYDIIWYFTWKCSRIKLYVYPCNINNFTPNNCENQSFGWAAVHIFCFELAYRHTAWVITNLELNIV